MVNVAHVIRTYGIHGGETQLALMLRGEKSGYCESFFFVFRDRACEAYFRKIPRLQLFTLLPFEIKPGASRWSELLITLTFLPILQVRLIWALRKARAQICIAHGFQAAFVSWPAAVVFRNVIKFGYVHRSTKSRIGRSRFFSLLYAPYRVVAGVSESVAASLRSIVKEDKLMVVQNGVDWKVIQNRVDECRSRCRSVVTIVTVGRLLPDKDHELVITAFSSLLRVHPECELWIVGDGVQMPTLMKRAKLLGIEKKVKFLGRVEDVPCILGQSDIFVHTSRFEGLSNAVLEAMAARLPSVVIDAPGVSECHVPGETGFVVPRDPRLLMKKLSVLAAEPDLRARMGKAAEERVKAVYSIETNRARYVELYRRLGAC